MSSEHHLVTSLSGNFYFGPVNFLITSACCKCHANIVESQPTLHKKNPRPTLNKKISLYRTMILYMHVELEKFFYFITTVPFFNVSLFIIYQLFLPYHISYLLFFLSICQGFSLQWFSYKILDILFPLISMPDTY